MTNSKMIEFYDPHPGLMGCTVPIPESVRIVAEYLSKNPMSLDEAIALIKESIDDIPDSEVSISKDMICLSIKTEQNASEILDYLSQNSKINEPILVNVREMVPVEHCWRIVFFREKLRER